MRRLVVATRKSRLALAQCRAWIEKLEALGARTEELHVVTTGDRVQRTPLSEIGGKGLFIKEIEEAVLDGRADLAVHSMKDVPAALAPSLIIGCVPKREDPRDVVVTRDGTPFEALPPGSRVGTSSLRRAVQLKAWRPEIEVVPLRGNVDTRLLRCEEGRVDAVVLALAGLRRLGLEERATEILDPSRCLPAIGQGALAIEHRESDDELRELLAPLNDPHTEMAVAAERGVMVAAEGSCQLPIAAHATREGADLWLHAMLADPDGSNARFGERRLGWPATPAEAHSAGLDLGRELKDAG